VTTALLLIDIQNDYFPGGAMELEGSAAAAQRAREALDFFRAEGRPIFHICHVSTRPGATFFLPGTPGAEIHELVRPLPDEVIIVKHFPNSFRDTPLLARLEAAGIKRLALCGMMTSMCVDATARAAFDLGFTNLLLHDAMATRSLAFSGEIVPARQVHAAFLAALGAVYGRLMPVGQLRDALA